LKGGEITLGGAFKKKEERHCGKKGHKGHSVDESLMGNREFADDHDIKKKKLKK